VKGPRDFFFTFFSGRVVKESGREGEGMSKMMDQWFQKAKPGEKGLTRPPASLCVSEHKNGVDLVCDSQYCLYDSLYLFCHCLHCKMYLRCVLNDVSPYTAVKSLSSSSSSSSSSPSSLNVYFS
jgi:hypothetical protein